MIRKPLFVLLFSLVGLTSPSHLEARTLGKISKDQKKTFSVAMKAMRGGNYPKARQNFQTLLDSNPDWGLVHLQLGQMALNTDSNSQRAISHLSKATRLPVPICRMIWVVRSGLMSFIAGTRRASLMGLMRPLFSSLGNRGSRR